MRKICSGIMRAMVTMAVSIANNTIMRSKPVECPIAVASNAEIAPMANATKMVEASVVVVVVVVVDNMAVAYITISWTNGRVAIVGEVVVENSVKRSTHSAFTIATWSKTIPRIFRFCSYSICA